MIVKISNPTANGIRYVRQVTKNDNAIFQNRGYIKNGQWIDYAGGNQIQLNNKTVSGMQIEIKGFLDEEDALFY